MFLDHLQAVLDPLAIGGSWPLQNTTEPLALTPEGDNVAPYLVWTPIVSLDQVTLAGPSGLQNTRLQIDCYAPRLTDADRLCRLVDAALLDEFDAIPLSRSTTFDPVVRLARVIREFSVWYSTADEGDDLKTYNTTLSAPGVGRVFTGALASAWSHTLSVTGAGAVSAAGLVEGTNDPTGAIGWTGICSLAPAGTDEASDTPVPPVALHSWRLLRHRLTALSGAGAIALFNTQGF